MAIRSVNSAQLHRSLIRKSPLAFVLPTRAPRQDDRALRAKPCDGSTKKKRGAPEASLDCEKQMRLPTEGLQP
jgi:hypothetical protein